MAYKQPVTSGEEIEIDIINIGEKGDGIGKHEGFVVIVPEAKIEKRYLVKVRKVFDKWCLADIQSEV